MKLIIRKMKFEDIQQVQEIAKISWHHTYDEIIPLEIQNKFLEGAYNVKKLEQRLKQTTMYVAEIDGKACGFANYLPVDTEGKCELAAIYLLPTYQGNGIGSAFLKQAIKDLPNLKQIHLYVEQQNKIGMNFYIAKGFKMIEQFEEDFDGHPLQTVHMMLKL